MAHAGRAGCNHHPLPEQQGALPQPAEPFLPFHSISDQTLAHFSPKNGFVQILVRNGDFFVWENDQKKPPPTHSTHTAIISPGLNMAAGWPGLLLWSRSTGCAGLST